VTTFGLRFDDTYELTQAYRRTRPSLWSRVKPGLLKLAVFLRACGIRISSGWKTFRPYSLSIFGLGFLVGAAFAFGLIAGLITAGLACFVAEWRIKE